MDKSYTPPSDPGFLSFAVSRAGYGARPGEIEALERSGFARWIEEQLTPDERADGAARARLDALRLPIKYAAGPGTPGPNGVSQIWDARDEKRPLATLDQPIESLWPLVDRTVPMDNAERRRPRDEVIAATILRAVHSRWSLRERLVSFWHDHFNVDAFGSDQVTAALPIYDRDVIRAHCLGNFRAFLEAVASSAAMQYYLSNRSSRAGAANENYARELFELHTLGREAYLNDRYNRWREVPGALKRAPSGYIDEDVYEAARAFTGWTVEDGTRIDSRTELPRTGRFRYVEAWHDGYQKRVLATEFDPFQPPLADGRKVLDLAADHPATARFLCTKLIRRFVADKPPASLIAAATAAWQKYRKAPDQIARVMRVILLSPEFATSRGAKLRRPLELVAAFSRATGLDLVPSEALANEMANAGQRLFGWPTPTGLPDDSDYFLTTNGMRRRWALIIGLADNAWQNGVIPAAAHEAAGQPTPRALTTYWLRRLGVDAAAEPVILQALGRAPDQPVAKPGDGDFAKRLARIAAYAALAPGFQSC
jgi:uncharacterized protein (DUF1800 family)